MESEQKKAEGTLDKGNPTLTKSSYSNNTDSWDISYYINFNPAKVVSLEPKKIIFNDWTTIVYWNDGTKTRSTCASTGGGDIFDEEVGFAMCLLKKMYGKKVYGKKLYKRMIAKATGHKQDIG